MSLLADFDTILDAEDEPTWRAAFFSKACELGFDFSLYATLPSATASFADVWVCSNYPTAWREHYDQQGYAAIDPTVSHCLFQNLPLIWSPEIFATPAQRTLYDEAKQHGLRAGISLPAHGPNGRVGMLCMVKDIVPDDDYWQQVSHQLALVMMLRDVIAQTCHQFISADAAPGNVTLTSREKECLSWAATGKTSKEIAQLIHCSEPTVNFHFNNIRRKLAVPSRQAAVAKAIEQRLIRQ